MELWWVSDCSSCSVKSHNVPFGTLPSAGGCRLSFACLRHYGWEVRRELLTLGTPGFIRPAPPKLLRYHTPRAAGRWWVFDVYHPM